METWMIVAAPVLVLLVWAVANYNALVRLRNHCHEAWAGIDTELKRRYELIPNLVETVKGYAAHEREVLQRVVEARSRAVGSTGSPASQAADENLLVNALKGLFVVVERYPQLKADQNFRQLQQELVITEDRIAAARRFYNGNVRDFNTRTQVFPSNLIAALGGFRAEDFFEVDQAVMGQPPGVKLT
jgi:LemA protein